MPRNIGRANAADPMDREWTTGFFKEPVDGILAAGALGIAGDGQADLVHHGGPDKAINVYPVEHHADWFAELGISPGPGDFGENLSTRGLRENDVCIGDIFRAGALMVGSLPADGGSRIWRRGWSATVEQAGTSVCLRQDRFTPEPR